MKIAINSCRRRLVVVVASLVAAAAPGTSLGADYEPKPRQAVQHVQQGSSAVQISTISARNDMTSGDDVLVRVAARQGTDVRALRVALNGTDISAAFRPTKDGAVVLGLVAGLKPGDNLIEVTGPGELRASLQVTNYPISGPVFSGPHQQPFVCQTQRFTPLPGNLGAAKDKNCSIDRRIDYVYVTKDNQFKALADLNARPADVAEMKAADGTTVPFIVRLETGTINRAIYQIAMPHNPADPAPDFMTLSKAWNQRLLYTFRGGARTGLGIQGTTTAGVLDVPVLSRGYAIASASLNVCNDVLTAETLMMVKERFIEAFGAPKHTMGWGNSAGAMQQHGIADNYPGLLNSALTGSSFPDLQFAIASPAADAMLLQIYFKRDNALKWTLEQQRAVSGFGNHATIQALADRDGRHTPVFNWAADVPQELRYDSANNPQGARATIYDHAVNVYGRDPKTGFVRRPLDNVGIQYGLKTLNEGVITVDQFLDVNEKVGGLDIDAKYQTERMVGDREAIRLAYATGRVLNGRGGLGAIPIIDYRHYLDLNPVGDTHQRYHSFSTRERLINANGHADNRVMLTVDVRQGLPSPAPSGAVRPAVWLEALDLQAQWLDKMAADTADGTAAAKTVRNKPRELVDACWTPDARPIKIVEPPAFEGNSLCNMLYRSFPSPRMIAGGTLADDIIACQLRPVDLAEYKMPFTPEQQARLRRVFAGGVCDWSKPGIGQVPLMGTWLSFGPSATELAAAKP